MAFTQTFTPQKKAKIRKSVRQMFSIPAQFVPLLVEELVKALEVIGS